MSGNGGQYLDLARALLTDMRTLNLATVAADGAPHASVAPFVCHGGGLYVYVSALADHTANLRARGEAAVLLVRDESHSPEPFARERLSLRCAASEQPRDSTVWHAVMDAFQARFGETAATVRGLTDFALMRLEPREARVVAGFARARALDAGALAALLAAAAPA